MPAPKLFRSLPDESNLRIGSTVGDSRHALLPPHRSATQMLLPSLSISTALSDPHFRPSGSCAQFSTVRYGFGASLAGEGPDCFPPAAGLTLTLTWTFVQQHWKPPPPSPDESLACRRRRYSPGVVKVAVVVALPPSAALTAGLAGSNVTAAGPRNRLQFRTTGGGPPA